MKWFNLKKNKCPRCDKNFGYLAFGQPGYVICPEKSCGFKISHKRYSEIVSSQVNKEFMEQWDDEGGED
jgi:hypothetical protein